MSNTKKRRKVSKVMSLMIGAMVLALAGFIFQDFGEFLLISILCTAGIGLLVWVPTAIFIGYILLSLLYSVRRGEEVELLGGQQEDEEDALHKYIREVTQPPYSQSKDAIRQTLQVSGWKGVEIEAALSDVLGPRGTQQ